MRKAAIPAAVLALLAPAAHGADLDPVGPGGWTGFYLGGFLGAGGTVSEITTPIIPGISFNGIGGEGLIGGFMGGFNYQLAPRLVIGAQGEFAFTDMSSTLDLTPLPFSASLKPQYVASASGRMGYLSNPDTLLYVIGGYSHARFKARLTLLGTSASVKQSYDGFHVGAGMETRLTSSITARIEYRYTQYGKENWGTGALLNAAPSSHAGMIGLAWNFGAPGLNAAPAADLPPPAHDWTGFYLGGHLGGGAVVNRLTSSLISGPSFDGVGGEGFHGGFFAGYNYQFSDNLVAGVQGELGLGDLSTDVNLAIATLSARPQYTLGFSARLGWLANQGTLLYLIGGYTHARYKAKVALFGASATLKENYDGFHVGAGMETRLTDHLSARVEYRFTQYGKEDWGSGGLIQIEPSSHKGMVGLAWNF